MIDMFTHCVESHEIIIYYVVAFYISVSGVSLQQHNFAIKTTNCKKYKYITNATE